MKTFAELQKEVGEWAQANFGNVETPFLDCVTAGNIGTGPRGTKDQAGYKVRTPMVACLGGLAPLMGMVEEVGEFAQAENGNDYLDALGDILIYLCDYCYREGIEFPIRTDTVEKVDRYAPLTGLAVHLGRLNHCHLKRHERIRGMEDYASFNEKRMYHLFCFVWHLEQATRNIMYKYFSINEIANRTWEKVVSKRNWTESPQDGGGHTHETGN